MSSWEQQPEDFFSLLPDPDYYQMMDSSYTLVHSSSTRSSAICLVSINGADSFLSRQAIIASDTVEL